jgi:hypothetical protein
MAAVVGTALASPTRVLAVGTPGCSALAWDAAPGARRYRILRADYHSVNIDAKLSPAQIAMLSPDMAMSPSRLAAGATIDKRVWVAGPYKAIGYASGTSFVDKSAKAGGRYDYKVVAVDVNGHASQPSNVASLPETSSSVVFGQLSTAVQRLVDATPKATVGLNALAKSARTTWLQAGPSASRTTLAKLRNAVATVGGTTRGAAATAAVADTQAAIFQLEKRASIDPACK